MHSKNQKRDHQKQQVRFVCNLFFADFGCNYCLSC